MGTLTIWTNFPRNESELSHLIDGAGPNRVVTEDLDRADVAFGQPEPDQVIRLTNLRWLHVPTAGYTKYDRDDVRAALHSRGAVMTNSSSVFDDPCAQHLLAMMLAMSRQLPQSLDNQRGSRDWAQAHRRTHSRLLNGQTALLVGYGAIARRLTELLAPFHMNLIGIRRTVSGDEPIRMATTDQIDELLPLADHVLDILPASTATRHFFGAERIARMKPTAIFYNVGRGDTVDQVSLRTALETGAIAGAYLDVTSPEPLPSDDPLWNSPNCFITPHTAGGHEDERGRQIDHFIANLRSFERAAPLRDRIV